MSIFKKIGKSLFGTLRAVLCISTFIFVCFVRDTTYLMSPTLLGGDYIIAFQQILGRRIWEEDSFGRLTVHREEGHTSTLKLDFLDKDKEYIATIYEDGKDAHYRNNPQAYNIRKGIVSAKAVLKLQAAPGGGYAISIMEVADKAVLKGLKKLK